MCSFMYNMYSMTYGDKVAWSGKENLGNYSFLKYLNIYINILVSLSLSLCLCEETLENTSIYQRQHPSKTPIS